MKSPSEFPGLNLCEPCSRLLTQYTDESDPDGNSIRYRVWYEEDGYGYTRIRRELEHAATSGCTFCKAVALRDKKYREHGSWDDAAPLFEEPRPAWYPPLDEKLKLRIRYNWVQNMLYIWARGGIHWRGGDLSWRMFTTPEDPAASIVHSQALLPDLGSPESFAEARSWMDKCLADHPECPKNVPVDLPTRLVEVSRLGESEAARLVETSGKKGHYCALSYCWGGDQAFKTLRERYDQYKEALPYHDLPQTIKDAFHVARGMGVWYIWIDAFCIIQDSYEDKQVEMAKMMSIYQNTQFTISAGSASAVVEGFLQTDYRDPKIGACYHPLRVDEHTMGSVIITENAPSFASVGAYQQPINTRGWTLQEAVLTPRLLMFTRIHQVWKCQSGYQPDFCASSRDKGESRGSERSPWDFWSLLCGYSFTPLKELRNKDPPKAPKRGQMLDRYPGTYQTWHSILDAYTERQLTVEADRLPAISAIAQAFAAHFQTEYYAGLWGSFLVHDLMWEAKKPASGLGGGLAESGSPSWSWAKLKGGRTYDSGNSDRANAEVVSCKTMLVSDRNPFGGVTGGELVICGYLGEVELDAAAAKLVGTKGDFIPDTEFVSDGGCGEWTQRRTVVFCLVLGNSREAIRHRDYPYCCRNTRARCPMSRNCRMMVLVESRRHQGCYERIGLAKAETYDAKPWWEGCERVTVTVV